MTVVMPVPPQNAHLTEWGRPQTPTGIENGQDSIQQGNKVGHAYKNKVEKNTYKTGLKGRWIYKPSLAAVEDFAVAWTMKVKRNTAIHPPDTKTSGHVPSGIRRGGVLLK